MMIQTVAEIRMSGASMVLMMMVIVVDSVVVVVLTSVCIGCGRKTA